MHVTTYWGDNPLSGWGCVQSSTIGAFGTSVQPNIYGYAEVLFNASNVNSIYTNNYNKVTPLSLSTNYYIRY